MKILCLDPGQCTGYGLIESVKGDNPNLLDYGIVPLIGQGVGCLVRSIETWLDNYVGRMGLVSRTTNQESTDARGQPWMTP